MMSKGEYWHRPTIDDEMGALPLWALALAWVVVVVGYPLYKLRERMTYER